MGQTLSGAVARNDHSKMCATKALKYAHLTAKQY